MEGRSQCDSEQLRELELQNQPFATLVSLMLSSQTKDEVTDAAVKQLRAALGGSISVQCMIDTEDSSVSEAISKVGFWRQKTVGFVLIPFIDSNKAPRRV
ncbi:uncharacterized protein EV420DRAFT_367560 [Desarmillaria tabescens]|uniref:HhH-GPD domain-containing protein n=1 Tax=Armillaria tabescens TaxID=1929756 RepID=A0AA39KER2_ARMTA|nr:uncharacterized protein EV420DRAFT_367560 [Desarmillaria tabescens]KAK0458610.1 hypothetical protein EV420DRAFT_367560 [Desarmillaria tabescens]